MDLLVGKNVTISGAGPSGLIAAIHLARAGYRVTVLERRERPGARFAGGFQVMDNYGLDESLLPSLQAMELPTDFLLRPLHDGVLFSPAGHPFSVTSAEAYGYLIRRGGEESLDASLYRTAIQSGVKFRFGERARRADIVATGPRQVDGVSHEWHFTTDDRFRIWVYFSPHHAPGGYAYLFTSGGRGTLGTAVTRHFASLPRCFERCLAFFRSVETVPMEEIREGHSYMNFFIRTTACRAGQRLVGEAAGFQDFLFGLGLRQALLTGRLAAESLLTGEEYDSLWRRSLGRRPSVSLVNRFLYEVLGSWGLERFLDEASREDFRLFLKRGIDGNVLHRLAVPFVRV